MTKKKATIIFIAFFVFLFAIILSVFFIISHNKSDYSSLIVEDEDKANYIYTCNKNNLCGLEKILIFDRNVILILDKDIYDSNAFEYGGNLYYSGINTYDLSIKIDLNNTYSSVYQGNHFIEVRDNKYIIKAYFDYFEKDIINPNDKIYVNYITINNKSIYINDGNLKLTSYRFIKDDIEEYYQEYNFNKGKWGSIKKEYYKDAMAVAPQ